LDVFDSLHELVLATLCLSMWILYFCRDCMGVAWPRGFKGWYYSTVLITESNVWRMFNILHTFDSS
jgi:hypothetical protein